jgi:hypothetical protein
MELGHDGEPETGVAKWKALGRQAGEQADGAVYLGLFFIAFSAIARIAGSGCFASEGGAADLLWIAKCTKTKRWPIVGSCAAYPLRNATP